jgi:hypothetical protein
MIEHCVRTARTVGVFKDFHVLSNRPLEGCRCYDAYQCDKTDGLFKLHYLKVGMSRLPFEYFIWVDADSVFVRHPDDPLGALGGSPIHVPLEFNLSALGDDLSWKGTSCLKLREAFERAGITNRVYLSQSAFWIVRRDAIDQIYELALQFWNETRRAGTLVDADASLGFAMQMLCADPEAHALTRRPDLWASDDLGQLDHGEVNSGPWEWKHPLGGEGVIVRPAIIHLHNGRSSLSALSHAIPVSQ